MQHIRQQRQVKSMFKDTTGFPHDASPITCTSDAPGSEGQQASSTSKCASFLFSPRCQLGLQPSADICVMNTDTWQLRRNTNRFSTLASSLHCQSAWQSELKALFFCFHSFNPQKASLQHISYHRYLSKNKQTNKN